MLGGLGPPMKLRVALMRAVEGWLQRWPPSTMRWRRGGVVTDFGRPSNGCWLASTPGPGQVVRGTVTMSCLASGHVRAMVGVHGPDDVLVRIGSGAPVQRDRLVNAALRRGWRVEVVDERRTSQGGSRHEHEASATKIAKKSGQAVHEMRMLAPTEGEIRDLQQRSRRASNGAITISAALAVEVCTGVMTMAEALLASGYSSSSTRTAD